MVSVVIPTRNGGERAVRVFERVADQRCAFEIEACVVDSGSRDGTEKAAQRCGFDVLSIAPWEFNHGITRDLGIRHVRGDVVALLVQDAVPTDRHWLERLVGPLLEDERAAGAFCRQVPIPGGNPILDQRLRGWIAGKDEPRRAQLESRRQWDELDPLERLDLVAFDNVASCVKRSFWLKHPFGNRAFGEDLAWSTWAIRAGHAIRFEPSAVVEHSHDRSPWYEARRIYCDHRNLNELLGMCSFPRLRDALRARPLARDHYLDILERANLPAQELAARRKWAKRYAWGETIAQWLAPRVNRAEVRGVWGWIDDRVRRGI